MCDFYSLINQSRYLVFLIYNASIKVLAGQTFPVGTESTSVHTLTIISISIARSAVT